MTQIATSSLPTDTEIYAMAGVLTRRYGTRAGEVALHFMQEHEEVGDKTRAALWGNVCELIASPPTLS